jgi:hypothetical protein
MEHDEYDDMIRRLTAMMYEQHERNQRQDVTNERLLAALEQQTVLNVRLVDISDRLEITQARIETLLSTMIRRSGNGQEP